MKRFSDLQDIERDITVKLTLRAITHNGRPCCCVSNGDTMYFNGPVDSTMCVKFKIGLLEPMQILVCMSDKIYDERLETAIIIDSITIDDLEIVPDFLHHAEYQNDHDQDIKTNYLGFNGVWSLTIPEPFYHWRHRVTGQGWLLKPTTRFHD